MHALALTTAGPRTIPHAVTMTGEQAVELLARLTAAERVISALCDDSTHPAAVAFADYTVEVESALFGDAGRLDDEQYEGDPIRVAVEARGCELAADALDAILETPTRRLGGVLRRGLEANRDNVEGFAEDYRSWAQRVREKGALR